MAWARRPRLSLIGVFVTTVVLSLAAVSLAGGTGPSRGVVLRIELGPDVVALGAREGPSTLAPASVPAGDPALKWTDLEVAQPPNRSGGALTWDSADQYVLLFGGENPYNIPTSYYNDTWSFAHGVWTNRTATVAPSPRIGFGLADDPADGNVVLFGGMEAHTDKILNDTWTYAGGVWTNVTDKITGASPPAVFWASMAYDNATGSVILFGGDQANTPTREYTNQTWSFHDDTWTNLTSTVAPPARNSASLVYDASDGTLILFGGQNASYFNDTWSFSDDAWEQVSATNAPDVRLGAGIAYDAASSEVVLFGGYPANVYPDDTFTYHAGAWARYDLYPGPFQSTVSDQMAYDYADQEVVLFEQQFGSDAMYTWVLNASGSSATPLTLVASAGPLSGEAPLTVTLTSDISGGTPPYTVTWEFGDGTPSLSGAPSVAGNGSHTYESLGTFNLELLASDSASGQAHENWTVRVLPQPLAARLQADPSTALVNQSVTFTSFPSGGVAPYTYVWIFGDGDGSTDANTTHAYANVGTYHVQLVLNDSDGGSVTESTTVTVSLPGTAAPGPAVPWWIYGAIAASAAIVGLVLLGRRRRRTDRSVSSSTSGGPVPPPDAGPPRGS